MKHLLLLLAFLLAAPLALHAQDQAGCKDSPLLTRFPGTTLDSCDDKPDSTYTFENIGPKEETKTLEGEYHDLHYVLPPNPTMSRAQIIRNYRTALQNAGYTKVQDNGDGVWTVNRGNTWIKVSVGSWGDYEFFILKVTAVTQDVVATAAELGNGIGSNGHVVVSGIFFDTGKSELKPESTPALDQVAKLLTSNPRIKVYVVGHTDNVGQLASNVELSKARAAAVVKALTTQYHIAADRLSPYGAGPYMPRASNDSEDGRSQNRRVELVKQ